MANQRSHNVLNVFIASPSDLQDERRVAREVVDSLNRAIGRQLSWHIELFGWEDTLPGYARPQEVINKDVDICDLFIGLLWKRWGEPTGKYTSGFEEEFERARKLREKLESPEIWIFFKQVEPEQIKDPGGQLKRVLGFRQALKTSKELLFKELHDSEDWRAKLYELLSQHVLKLALPRLQAAQVVVPPVASLAPQVAQSSPPPSLSRKEATEEPALVQLMELMSTIAKEIPTCDFNVYPTKEMALDSFHIARLYLLATMLISRHSNETLGVHEINLLYCHRRQLKVTPRERMLLMRTLMADSYEVIPGWYWFQNWDQSTMESILFRLTTDQNVNVQQRAIGTLESAGIHPPKESFKDFLNLILENESEQVRKAGMSYLKAIGTIEDIPIIESAIINRDSAISDEASLVKLLIIARNDPNHAIRELIEIQKTVPAEILAELKKQATCIDKDLLTNMLRYPDADIHILAINELAQRGELSKELALKLLKDPSLEVKKVCYMELIKQGTELDPDEVRKALEEPPPGERYGLLQAFSYRLVDPDEVILALYRTFTYDRLLSQADYFSVDGSIAYKALVLDHFPKISEQTRSDLSDSFETVKQRSIEKYRAKYGNITIPTLKEELDKFIRRNFMSAALSGLAIHGEPSDIQIGRRYLLESDNRVRLEAVRIVERFGDASDVGILIDIAKDSYGKLKELAAFAAIKLAPGVSGAACTLLETEDQILVGLAVKSLLEEDSAEVLQLLEPLLVSKNDITRPKVLVYFVKKCPEEELKQLLSRYIKRPNYYYNIICWLDRVLYAPPPLKQMYMQELEAKLG